MESIKVGPWIYKIEYRPLTDDEMELLETDVDDIAGICLRASKKIVILPEYKDEPAVLIHEIGHAIDYEYPIYALEDHEARADVLSSAVFQLVSDNPQFIELIRGLRFHNHRPLRGLGDIEARLISVLTDINLIVEDLKEVQKNVE